MASALDQFKKKYPTGVSASVSSVPTATPSSALESFKSKYQPAPTPVTPPVVTPKIETGPSPLNNLVSFEAPKLAQPSSQEVPRAFGLEQLFDPLAQVQNVWESAYVKPKANTPVAKTSAAFETVFNLPASVIGNYIAAPILGAVTTGAEAITGQPQGIKYNVGLTGGAKGIDVQGAQSVYYDSIMAGASPTEAFINSAVKLGVDLSIAVPMAWNLSKAATLKYSPESLLKSVEISRQNVIDIVNGRPVDPGLVEVFKNLTPEQKSLVGKELLSKVPKPEPSILGRVFGLTDENAQLLFNDITRTKVTIPGEPKALPAGPEAVVTKTTVTKPTEVLKPPITPVVPVVPPVKPIVPIVPPVTPIVPPIEKPLSVSDAIITYKREQGSAEDRAQYARDIIDAIKTNPIEGTRIAQISQGALKQYEGKTIYRAGGPEGMSWTLDEDVARFFLEKDQTLQEKILTKDIIDRVIFYEGAAKETKINLKQKGYDWPYQYEDEILLAPTQQQKIAQAVKEIPKTIKQVTEETQILEKPAEMIKKMIEMTTKEGEVVLDPFAGSGVVPAEAIKIGRKAVAIEKKPEVVENIIKPRVAEAAKLVTKLTPKKQIDVIKKLVNKKNQSLPILNYVQVKDGVMMATNLEFGIKSKTNLPDGMYKIIGDELIPTTEQLAKDFPLVPTPTSEVAKINSSILGPEIDNAIKFVSKNATRPELGSIHLKNVNSQMRITATDSHRLYTKSLPSKIEDDFDVMLADAKDLKNSFPLMEGITTLKVDKGMASFSSENGNEIVMRTIDGAYPEIRKLYEAYNLDEQYIIDKDQLTANLKLLKPFVSRLEDIQLDFSKDKLTITAKHKDEVGETISKVVEIPVSKISIPENNNVVDGSIVMPLKAEAEAKGITVNINYLADSIAVTDDPIHISINSKESDTPIHISNKNEFTKKVSPEIEEMGPEEPLGFNPHNLDDLEGSAVKPEVNKIIKRSEIAKELSDKLGVPIRRGKFRHMGAIGLFKPGPKVIRIKAGGLATIFHEVGHFLDSNFKLSDNINIIERKALMEEYGFKYEGQPKRQRQEALAEFLRFKMTGQIAKAEKLAPIFSKEFEQRMNQLPEIKSVLEAASQDFKRWQEQPAVAKVLSNISFGPEDKGSLLNRTTNLLHEVYTWTLDDLHPLAEFSALSKKFNPLKAEKDPYILARNLRGWVGKADTFLNKGTFGKDYWENVNGKIVAKYKGKSFTDILQPIETAGKLDDLRVYLVAKRVVELRGRNISTGISSSDAKTAIDELLKKNPEFEETASELYKYQDDLLNYAYENGLIGEEGLAKIKELNKFRVPFYRVMEQTRSAYMGGKKIAGNLPSPIKKIKGSERDIIDPLESIVKDTYAIINAAERNNVGVAMANLSKTHYELGRLFEEVVKPMAPIKIDAMEVIKKSLADTGLGTDMIPEDMGENIVTMFKPIQDRGPNMLNVNMGDKQKVFQVEPDLFKAIQGLDSEDMGMLTRIFATPARLLRAGATLSPDFLIRNPLRDQFSAFVYSKYGYIPGWDLAKGIFEIFKPGDAFNLWRMSGGEHSMLVSLDRNYLQKNVNKLLSSRTAQALHYIKHPIEALRVLSELGEQATRLGEMKRALESGASPIEAAFASREVTLDFARIGAKTKAVNSIVAFWNANFQGLDRLPRAFRNAPFRTSFKIFAGITLPSILLYLANRNDERYKEIPQWQKDLFWIILTPNHIYRIPKPFELGILFGTVPERIMEYIDEQDPTVFEDMLTAIVKGATPGFIPTFLAPIIENITNWSFFLGRPIVSRGTESLPAEAQYGTYTAEVNKLIGEKLGVSPAKLENLILGYTGGLGRYATMAIDKILEGTGITNAPSTPSKTIEDYPLLKAFMVRPPVGTSSESVNKIYEMNTSAAGKKSYAKNLYEAGDVAKFEQYVKDNPEIAYSTFLSRIIDRFSEINKIKGDIRESRTLDPKIKRDKIMQLDKLETDLARQALDQVK